MNKIHDLKSMQSDKLRIIFMGTPEFAVTSLQAIVNAGFDVIGVVTTPDKPAGRGLKMQESAVKLFARELGIPILQPDKLKDPEFIENLKAFNADLQVVVAFRMLPEIVWGMPRLGTINLHASLLPHYRGAAPINHAIISGDSETGVTTFFIEKEIDTGKIIFNAHVPVSENENAGQLHDKLKETGGELLVKTLRAIEAGNYPQTDQRELLKDGEIPKLAPKIFKEDCKINWNKPVAEIHNFIRGLSPYPAAWSVIIPKAADSKISFKIYESVKETGTHKYQTGAIITDSKKYLKIAVPGGFIHITSIQVEGKKRLGAEEFLRGFKITDYNLEIV